ncbi:hypothetical protein HDU97_009383 [Phlyctochytrium planicorne]|nr:hypothetical protein HDU97_009383 [Phlyctochytrium planicorne]
MDGEGLSVQLAGRKEANKGDYGGPTESGSQDPSTEAKSTVADLWKETNTILQSLDDRILNSPKTARTQPSPTRSIFPGSGQNSPATVRARKFQPARWDSGNEKLASSPDSTHLDGESIFDQRLSQFHPDGILSPTLTASREFPVGSPKVMPRMESLRLDSTGRESPRQSTTGSPSRKKKNDAVVERQFSTIEQALTNLSLADDIADSTNVGVAPNARVFEESYFPKAHSNPVAEISSEQSHVTRPHIHVEIPAHHEKESLNLIQSDPEPTADVKEDAELTEAISSLQDIQRDLATLAETQSTHPTEAIQIPDIQISKRPSLIPAFSDNEISSGGEKETVPAEVLSNPKLTEVQGRETSSLPNLIDPTVVQDNRIDSQMKAESLSSKEKREKKAWIPKFGLGRKLKEQDASKKSTGNVEGSQSFSDDEILKKSQNLRRQTHEPKVNFPQTCPRLTHSKPNSQPETSEKKGRHRAATAPSGSSRQIFSIFGSKSFGNSTVFTSPEASELELQKESRSPSGASSAKVHAPSPLQASVSEDNEERTIIRIFKPDHSSTILNCRLSATTAEVIRLVARKFFMSEASKFSLVFQTATSG